MAKRSGAQIDFVWVHTQIVGNDANSLKALVASEYQKDVRLSNAIPSVNLKADGSEALIKVNSDNGWTGNLPPGLKARVIRVFHEGDDSERLALVMAEAWTGAPEERTP